MPGTCILQTAIQAGEPVLTRSELALLTWPATGPARQMLLDRLEGTADGAFAEQVALAADELFTRDRDRLALLRRELGLVPEVPWSGLGPARCGLRRQQRGVIHADFYPYPSIP